MTPQLAAAHQPNFFPWTGWFDKLRVADVFIILDDVQFPRGGHGNWGNRVPIQQNGKRRWLTASVERKLSGLRVFNETLFSSDSQWQKNCMEILKNAYRKAPFYREAIKFVSPLVDCSIRNLVGYNMNAIHALTRLLGLDDKKFVYSSRFKAASTGSRRIAELVAASGCSAYLYGGGCSGYQRDEDFKEAGINLVAQNFQPVPYAQFHQEKDKFLPGLSILDLLFCLGLEGTALYFQSMKKK